MSLTKLIETELSDLKKNKLKAYQDVAEDIILTYAAPITEYLHNIKRFFEDPNFEITKKIDFDYDIYKKIDRVNLVFPTYSDSTTFLYGTQAEIYDRLLETRYKEICKEIKPPTKLTFFNEEFEVCFDFNEYEKEKIVSKTENEPKKLIAFADGVHISKYSIIFMYKIRH